LICPIVPDVAKAARVLRWAASEVEKRFYIFSRVGVNNITRYNSRLVSPPPPPAKPSVSDYLDELEEEIVNPTEDLVLPPKLSQIVILISGIETLLASRNPEILQSLDFLLRNARPSGVHLVLISDRSGLNVIPEHISAEIPSRVALRFESRAASRSFLGEPGAECLTGSGDMLFVPKRGASAIRLQGALISDSEIIQVVGFIAQQANPSFLPDLHKDSSSKIDEDEELIQQCIEVVRVEQMATPALLQRRFRLGYTRAARILDELENRGIVGPSKGAESRAILVGREPKQF
jgi:S-DNA-T family DNA segregation ATPase FtsK/SpoIIIE